MNSTVETRTFVGESVDSGLDGFAGFRIGQTYSLRVTWRRDGNVGLTVENARHYPGVGLLVLTVEQFEKWFVKG